jgi:hypothetical protein
MPRFPLAALIALVLATAPAAAQRRTEVPAGSRVRLAVPVLVNGLAVRGTRTPATGTLVSVDSFAVTARMDRDGALLTVPITSITRMQVSRGRMSASQGGRRGLRVGALAGGGFAAGSYALLYLFQAVSDRITESNCDFNALDCEKPFDPDLPYMVPALAAGTAGGALIGFALGSREQERWQGVRPRSLAPVDAPRELTLTVTLHR